MKIIGAGMAGLVAGHMLRRHKPTIWDANPQIPQNHSALLRFRSDAVSRATSIPFKEVSVRKGVVDKNRKVQTVSTIPDINSYAEKVTGTVEERSVGNLASCQRWVAPPNFVNMLYHSNPAEIEFGKVLDELTLGTKDNAEPWISTIPMPSMMALVGWSRPEIKFQSSEIMVFNAQIGKPLTSVYQTVYFPYKDPWQGIYRASIHGDELIIEAVGSSIDLHRLNVTSAAELAKLILSEVFGIPSPLVIAVTCRTQKFGKISPIPDDERKAFIRFLTEEYNIFSLGRFATWRPILLDDIVKDIEVIESLRNKTSYDRLKH